MSHIAAIKIPILTCCYYQMTFNFSINSTQTYNQVFLILDNFIGMQSAWGGMFIIRQYNSYKQ